MEMQHTQTTCSLQLITLDQVYQAKLEHIAGTSKMGADDLSNTLIQEVYTINNLVCTSNLDFPLTMDKIREEQDLKKKLLSQQWQLQ